MPPHPPPTGTRCPCHRLCPHTGAAWGRGLRVPPVPQCCGTQKPSRHPGPHSTQDAHGPWDPRVTQDPMGYGIPMARGIPVSPRTLCHLGSPWHMGPSWYLAPLWYPRPPCVTWDLPCHQGPLWLLEALRHPAPMVTPGTPYGPQPPTGTHCGTPWPPAPIVAPITRWHTVGWGGSGRISEPTSPSPPHIWGCADPKAAAPSHSIALLQGGCAAAWGLHPCMGKVVPLHGGGGGEGLRASTWEGAALPHGGCIPLWGLRCSVPARPRCAAAGVCGAAKHSAGLKPPHSQRAPPGDPPDGSGLDPDPQRRSPQPASRGGPAPRGHGCATGVSPCPPPPFPVPPPHPPNGSRADPPPALPSPTRPAEDGAEDARR